MSVTLLANVTCVSIGGRGLLISGRPGSGKSSLALALIDRGAILVGDDGVSLADQEGILRASPPPRIDGKIEIRGVGLIELPCTDAPVCLALELDSAAPRAPQPGVRVLLDHSIPLLPFRAGDAVQALRAEYALERFGIA